MTDKIVSEKLQFARAQLPSDANPVMAPISSIMGEIMLLGLRSNALPSDAQQATDQKMELRTLGEFTVRNRLLAIEGVSQVTVMGGILKQYQVITSPDRLAAQNVTLGQLTEAVPESERTSRCRHYGTSAARIVDSNKRTEPFAFRHRKHSRGLARSSCSLGEGGC